MLHYKHCFLKYYISHGANMVTLAIETLVSKSNDSLVASRLIVFLFLPWSHCTPTVKYINERNINRLDLNLNIRKCLCDTR